MTTTIDDIADYYDYKVDSYNAKYNLGYYTHIHTGFYPAHDFRLLHDENVDPIRFGLNRIKYLLFMGQETLVRGIGRLLHEQRPEKPKVILDCGCGHGGTAIFLAENYRLSVVGLTVAARQVVETERFAAMAGVEELVKARRADVFTIGQDDEFYDAVVAIDALCQIGRFHELCSVLAGVLRRGGLFVVSDAFINASGAQFKGVFDSAWLSDISPLVCLLEAAKGTGFAVERVVERTRAQMPFWRLSVAYTLSVLTGGTCLGAKEVRRLERSEEFHRRMYEAYRDDELRYYSVVMRKV